MKRRQDLESCKCILEEATNYFRCNADACEYHDNEKGIVLTSQDCAIYAKLEDEDSKKYFAFFICVIQEESPDNAVEKIKYLFKTIMGKGVQNSKK